MAIKFGNMFMMFDYEEFMKGKKLIYTSANTKRDFDTKDKDGVRISLTIKEDKTKYSDVDFINDDEAKNVGSTLFITDKDATIKEYEDYQFGDDVDVQDIENVFYDEKRKELYVTGKVLLKDNKNHSTNTSKPETL